MPRMEMSELDRINHELLPYVVGLLLLPNSETGPTNVIFSGSGTLIDTGTRRILVTCWHVWRRFKEIAQKCPKVRIGMSRGIEREMANITNLELIDKDEGLDLAILDAGDPDLIAGTRRRFLECSSWPPPRPKVGEFLHAMGYPGCERKTAPDLENLQLVTCTVADFIVNVGDRNISIADEENIREVFGDRQSLQEGFRMDGMSGCPAYVIRDSPELVGIVYEANEALNGIVIAVHADFIMSDGRIDRGLIPHC